MPMELEQSQTCQGCRHYKQHYVRGSHGKFLPTYCGHCANPHLRDKKPDAAACHRFSLK